MPTCSDGDEVLSMHAPAHNFMSEGHFAPQRSPSHVALPLAGASQGVHDAPQVATSSLGTQPDAQRCSPEGQPSTVPDSPALPPAADGPGPSPAAPAYSRDPRNSIGPGLDSPVDEALLPPPRRLGAAGSGSLGGIAEPRQAAAVDAHGLASANRVCQPFPAKPAREGKPWADERRR